MKKEKKNMQKKYNDNVIDLDTETELMTHVKEKSKIMQYAALVILENAQSINVENLRLQYVKAIRLKRLSQ